MASVNNYALVETPFTHTPTASGDHVSTLTYRAGCTHVPTINLGTGNPSVNALTLTTAKSGLIPANDAKYVTCAWGLSGITSTGNNLTAFDVSANTALTTLYIHVNSLLTLSISANKLLRTLYCYSNSITALGLSANTDLRVVSCQGNSITTLDVSANTLITYLDCGTNNITALNVASNTALVTFSCAGNGFNDAGINSLIAGMDTVAWTTTARVLNISNMPNAANIDTGTTCASLDNLASKGWVITYEQGNCTV